jgi:hypothetical protein
MALRTAMFGPTVLRYKFYVTALFDFWMLNGTDCTYTTCAHTVRVIDLNDLSGKHETKLLLLLL